MIEIKHLRLLQAIETHGTLTAAAGELGYTQSAVSQQLQGLERQLGTPVIVRTQRGSRLTEAGRVLVTRGKPILQQLRLAEKEVSAVAGLRTGEVRLAAFPSAVPPLVAGALARLAVDYPGLHITLTEAEPANLLELVLQGEVDIAVVFQYSTQERPDPGGLAWYPLLSEEVSVAFPPGHPLLARDRVALEDLRDERWIAGCPRCRVHLLDACHAAGFTPDVVFEADDYIAIQSLVARGLGVAMLSALQLAEISLPGVQRRPLQQQYQRSVSAVLPHRLSEVPAIDRTIRTLMAESRQLVESGRASAPFERFRVE